MAKGISLFDIKDILEEYSNNVQEAIADEIEKTSKNGLSKIKRISPVNKKRTKHKEKYAKGWRIELRKGVGYVNATIYNDKDYRLTHLLENGHLTRNGKKTKAIPHISIVQEEIENILDKRIEDIIKNGA